MSSVRKVWLSIWLVSVCPLFVAVLAYARGHATKAFTIPAGEDNLVLVFLSGYDEKLPDLYIDDMDVIRQMEKEWRFAIPSPQYKCVADYEGYLVQGGTVISSLEIRLSCKSITTEYGGCFRFDTSKWKKIAPSLKPLVRKESSFERLSDARREYQLLQHDETVLYIKKGDWSEYDGYFSFFADSETFSTEEEEKLLSSVRKAYPDQSYKITVQSYSWNGRGTYEIKVTCNEDFYDMFTLYKKGSFTSFGSAANGGTITLWSYAKEKE